GNRGRRAEGALLRRRRRKRQRDECFSQRQRRQPVFFLAAVRAVRVPPNRRRPGRLFVERCRTRALRRDRRRDRVLASAGIAGQPPDPIERTGTRGWGQRGRGRLDRAGTEGH
ncbi:unnamed protein product, partial [Ectocarpus sp. 12 AP-2014]